MPRKSIVACLALLAAGTASSVHAQTIFAYLSAPNTQFAPSSVPNTMSETFNGLSVGNQTNDVNNVSFSSAIGKYSGTFAAVADDQYGNGTGKYFSIGAQSQTADPVTLTFTNAITYFGLSYQAGDNLNGFSFYDANGNLLGRYSTATLTAALNGGAGTVTTLDGDTYTTTQYYGKPNGAGPSSDGTRNNTKTNTAQPYSFVNFFASEGTTISKIVFDNSNSTSSGFESDNHTISTDASIRPPTSGKYVPIGTAAAVTPDAVVAPDASTLALATSALPVFGLIALRRRKRA